VAGFSAADAAFTGFRIVWERPLAVVIWSALQFAVTVGYTLFVTVSAGPAFMQAAQASLQLNPDPAPMIARLQALAPTYAVLLFAFLVLYAVLYAAMNRAVLRPDQSRFGYLRLASDELRQLGLFALMSVLAVGLYVAVVVVAGVILALLGLVAGDTGMLMALVVLAPLLIGVFIFVGVRFSLASPLTFERGRVDLFGSWRLTRGRFWALFGTYLLAAALSLVVVALTLAIAVFAVAIIGGGFGAIGDGAEPDLRSIATALTPPRLIYMAITAIGSALSLPITMTPPAAIYRALTGGAPASVSRAFE
jgi:hypothetical protein